MRKKIFAFYDVLLFSIICGPLMICSILIFVYGQLNELEWTLKYWYLVFLFAVGIMFPIGCSLLIRYILIYNGNSIYFHYFPFTANWGKAANNIEAKWNQTINISEVKEVEIVKLTEEKKMKVYYKHWFNKYLKISIKNSDAQKYIYIGNYSNCQIKKIIKILTNNVSNKNDCYKYNR